MRALSAAAVHKVLATADRMLSIAPVCVAAGAHAIFASLAIDRKGVSMPRESEPAAGRKSADISVGEYQRCRTSRRPSLINAIRRGSDFSVSWRHDLPARRSGSGGKRPYDPG
jgi:hypothetical protein